ncbi:uncharacterized protein LOC142628841 [Castanea sativa]|uniref:uncharacterized protein LOC142628841 n=1 Tax=Castanea sativa TaxID=21020 RepID=UPI003F64C272
MSRLEEEEVLFAYIALASHAVSLVLVRVEDGIQWSVYYVSKSLHKAEVRYLPLVKASLVVVHATKKLPHYFQAHTMVVLTQLPLQSLLRKADYTGRVAKWGMILRAFYIKYMPQTSIKGQVLADLVAEFTESLVEEEVEEHSLRGNKSERIWGGLAIVSLDKITIEKSLRLGFLTTNNEAKYEALLIGVAMVQKMGGKVVEVFSDSRLIVGQVKGELEARDLRIQDLPRVILVEGLLKLAKEKRCRVQVHQIRFGPSWMDPFVLFLKEKVLPDEKGEEEKIRRKAP